MPTPFTHPETGLSKEAQEALTAGIVPSIAELAIKGLKETGKLTKEDAVKHKQYESGNIPEQLNVAYQRSIEVYNGYAVMPNQSEITKAWENNPNLQAYYEALETAGLAPEIIISAKNLSIQKWQNRFYEIALNQPEDAPNKLDKKATDGVGLRFEHNTIASEIYNKTYPDQDTIEWEITVIPTKTGYQDSGVANYVSHDLSRKGKKQTINSDYKTQDRLIKDGTTKAITVRNHPSTGTMLSYYAEHLIYQEEVPESIWTLCHDETSACILNVGFGSVDRQVSVGYVDVSNSFGNLGVRASVREEIGS